jgi:hypothetical protein
MPKRKIENQIDNLTPNHLKSRIDPISLHVGGAWQAIEKLSTRFITLLWTSSRSEVYTQSYNPARLWEFQPWQFQDSHLGIPGQKVIWMWASWRGIEYTIWGKVGASPESGPWWVLWVRGCSWFVLAPKVLQLCTNHFVLVLCRSVWIVEACQFFLVPSQSSSTPLYPSKVLRTRERALSS